MTRLRNHPGQTLETELKARELTADQLALALGVPANRVMASLRGEQPITAETAVRLGRYMGTGAVLWMNLQAAYDVSVVDARQRAAIDLEVLPASSAPQRAD